MFDMFDDREYGHFLLDNIDLDAQLLAVGAMLTRNRQADSQLAEDIKALDERVRVAKGGLAEHLVDLSVDEMHRSVYQSAATSAAAVGALAPLLESFFCEIFASFRKNFEPELTDGFKGLRDEEAEFDPWNPYQYLGSDGPRTEIALGIIQLAQATGLAIRLPEDHGQVIEALFTYRNKMLHRGFEWPKKERKSFLKVADEKRWPATWFSQATSGGEPWVIYITDEFIDRCLDLVHQLLEAGGGYHRELLARRTDVVTPEEYKAIIANPENLKP